MADTPDTVEIELQEAIHLAGHPIAIPRLVFNTQPTYDTTGIAPGPSGVMATVDTQYNNITPVVTLPAGTVLKVKLRSQFFETDEGNEGVA